MLIYLKNETFLVQKLEIGKQLFKLFRIEFYTSKMASFILFLKNKFLTLSSIKLF